MPCVDEIFGSDSIDLRRMDIISVYAMSVQIKMCPSLAFLPDLSIGLSPSPPPKIHGELEY